jgi:hypothetical protein
MVSSGCRRGQQWWRFGPAIGFMADGADLFLPLPCLPRGPMLFQCSSFAFRCGLGNESCGISNGWCRGATWKVDVLGLRRSDAPVGFAGVELCSRGVEGLICISSFFQGAFCKGLEYVCNVTVPSC